MAKEYTRFKPGEEPQALTSISDECQAGDCGKCRGIFKRDDYPGESIFCIHECHEIKKHSAEVKGIIPENSDKDEGRPSVTQKETPQPNGVKVVRHSKVGWIFAAWHTGTTAVSHFCILVLSALTQKIWSVPKLRKVVVGLGALGVPSFIAIGFGVQAVNPATEEGNAILWFSAAAGIAALALLALEDIRPNKVWATCLVIVALEVAIFMFFHQSLAWVEDKANEAAAGSISKDAYESRTLAAYNTWAKSAKQPEQIRTTPNVSHSSAAPTPKPDFNTYFLYPSALSIQIVNTSSALLHSPKFSPAIWNLDRAGADGRPIILPIPVQEGTWIRSHEAFGPESLVSNVQGLIKPGDRLFGFITVLCADCERSKAYWVYLQVGIGGWYSEVAKGFPDLGSVSAAMPDFKDHFEESTKPISEKSRVAIYGKQTDVPGFQGVPLN